MRRCNRPVGQNPRSFPYQTDFSRLLHDVELCVWVVVENGVRRGKTLEIAPYDSNAASHWVTTGLRESAWTGHAGMHSLQCVQVGSSTIASRSSRCSASTGHNATQAAQPKHRSSSTSKMRFGSLAMVPDGRSPLNSSPLPHCFCWKMKISLDN